MIDDDNAIEIPFVPPDEDRVWRNYLRTCAMAGVEPVSHERAGALMGEWNEVPLGRPEPTTQA